MTAVPGAQYYRARSLWLQHSHGNYTEETAKQEHCQDREKEDWRGMSGTVQQDANGALLQLYQQLVTTHNIFPGTD